ncbi:MAG: EAL domain-containing protein [Campylobacterales bacterium]|nr:EAL domain-containing protein [Campylobacterales bacterium]
MLTPELCKDIRLLYVEDDPKARESMVKIFSKFFTHICVGVDGLDGLDKFTQAHSDGEQFDLIITDINMHQLSGIDMLQKIIQISPNIYSLVVTANSDQKSFMDCIQLGVKGYIIKPLNLKQFIDTLEQAVFNINSQKQINILNQYKQIVDKNAIVSKTDSSGKITFANDKFCEVSGYTAQELIGKNHRIVRHPDTPDELFNDLWTTITSKQNWKGIVKNLSKNGNAYYVDALVCPILDHNNNIIEFIAMRNDITEMINPKKQLFDAIKQAKKPLLAIAKIGNYTALEHLYDEHLVDKIEHYFEKNLKQFMPNGCEFDDIYNLGEGEFALFKDVGENEQIINATQKEIQLKKFQQNVNKHTFEIDGYDFKLPLIISFSTSSDKIYENVKYGLQKAIAQKIDIIFANDFSVEVQKEALKNSQTIKMIQKAIEEKKIVSYFQPITNNDNMKIEKYESLVRLIDETGKVVSPYFFLEVAKNSGYYNKITNIVIDNYFEALNKTDKEISLNLSAIDIEDLDIRNKLINLVTGNMHNAHRMVFELLEDEEVKDFEVVKDFIALVKTFGVKIAIDDFGAGVSNFERLLDYQPDILKIDACLIKNIDKDKYSRDVVETIQLFAWKQKIKTVAEFVDTQQVLQTVKDIGINYTQGFLLGKPEPLA